jgi:hypothetical protein
LDLLSTGPISDMEYGGGVVWLVYLGHACSLLVVRGEIHLGACDSLAGTCLHYFSGVALAVQYSTAQSVCAVILLGYSRSRTLR